MIRWPAFLLMLLWPLTSFSAKSVCSSCTYTTINAALVAATSGEVITVAAGSYNETLLINKSVTINGAGSATTTIASTALEVIQISGSSTNVTLTGFFLESKSRRALRINAATVTLQDIAVTGMSAAYTGLGLYIINGAEVVASDLTFSENDSKSLAGAHLYCEDSTLTVSTSLFELGLAQELGGAAHLDGCTASFTDTTFEENQVEKPTSGEHTKGGAIFASNTDLTCTRCTFTSNFSEEDGGAISITEGPLTLTDSTFTGNNADDDGGAVYQEEDSTYDGMTLTNVSFVNNGAQADTPSGSIYDFKSGGGAIWASYETIVINESEFTDNRAMTTHGDGGAIFTSKSSLTIHDSTFENNSADAGNGYGGAIFTSNTGSFTLKGNEFNENTAQMGGAVAVLEVDSLVGKVNTFCLNSAGGSGGAFWEENASSTLSEWVNNTFVENRAADEGGGVFLTGSILHLFTNNTFLANSAADGGAFYAEDDGFSLVNNLIAYTVLGDGVSTASSTTSYTADYNNLYDNNTAGFSSSVTSTGTHNLALDPLLVDYSEDADCSNDDLRLSVSSPLIDAGDPTILDPDATTSDIGAYGGPSAPAWLFEDTDNDDFIAMWDCDDGDPDVYPGAVETPYDGIDQDCDGADLCDVDGDLFNSELCPTGGTDCDDDDEEINPSAEEIWYDDIDQNCDDGSDYDQDGDGEDAWPPTGDGTDCNDTDFKINTLAEEIWYDGIDQNCNEDSDFDQDGDGQDVEPPTGTGEDCDDTDNSIYVGAPDLTEDGIDQNCDDIDGGDLDSDGYVGTPSGDDCDDSNPAINPGAEEIWYDGIDQNCDDNDSDQDLDGYAASSTTDGDDCNDTNPSVYPGARDFSGDGIDSNCDGAAENNTGPDGAGPSGCTCDAATIPSQGFAWLACLVLALIGRRRLNTQVSNRDTGSILSR